jgi:hypothetical protein
MEENMKASSARTAASVLAVLVVLTGAATSQSKKCTPMGGVILTDVGVPDANSTMGYATGDLKGAVGVTILSTEGTGNTLILHVQHHWVSESGDIISVDPATATTTQVAPGLYAVVTYPFHINGRGTGKFAGVSGDGTAIGEADFVNGRIGLRYAGQICSATGN